MQVRLPEHAVLSLDLNRQECFIQCIEGRLWVTVPGDGRDHCFEAGDLYTLAGTGRAVIEAVLSASIGLRSPARLTVHVDEAASKACEACLRNLPIKSTGDLSLQRVSQSCLSVLGWQDGAALL